MENLLQVLYYQMLVFLTAVARERGIISYETVPEGGVISAGVLDAMADPTSQFYQHPPVEDVEDEDEEAYAEDLFGFDAQKRDDTIRIAKLAQEIRDRYNLY